MKELSLKGCLDKNISKRIFSVPRNASILLENHNKGDNS